MSRSRDIANIGDDVASGTVLTSSGAIDVNASAPADSVAIDASGNVGIGTDSPSAFGVNVVRGSGMGTEPTWESITGRNIALLETDQSEGYLVMGAPASGFSQLSFADAGSKAAGGIGYSHGDNSLRFRANDAERMRIDSSGTILTGEAITNATPIYNLSGVVNAGVRISSAVGGYALSAVSSSVITCILNRTNNDGTLIEFKQDGTAEGSITVSGTTVSYNGGHLARWSRLADDSKDTSILKGTVMTNLDEMVEWSHAAVEAQDAVYDEEGNVITEAVEAKEAYTEDNEQLNKMAVSSVEGDPNVAGVFVNWDDDDDDFNDMNIAMTGDMVIRIAEGVTVERGDLLMSAGDGTAKPQGDDIVRSKTIAKVTSTHVSHTYDDGSYLVPCVLMAC